MDLHTACACGDYAYVRQLLDKGDDANRLNVAGKTPLKLRCCARHTPAFCAQPSPISILFSLPTSIYPSTIATAA